MRTTISLDDQLLKRAKKAAAERGVSFAQLVEEAVREALAKKPAPSKPWTLPPPVGGGSVVTNDQIRDALDADDREALERVGINTRNNSRGR